MREGVTPALGPPRPPLHGRGASFRFGTTKAPTAWAWGASSALGRARPPPHGRGGLLRFGTTRSLRPMRQGRQWFQS